MNAMPFANYEGFKELFVRNDGQRKNKVLLAYLKTSELRKYVRNNPLITDNGKKKLLEVRDMADLFKYVDNMVAQTSTGTYGIRIMDTMYWNDTYKCDGANGICVDGDIRAYRYMNMERNGQVFKMKIGKMYTNLISKSAFGKLLPEQVVKWMGEEMTRRWESYASAKLPTGLTLNVDDDFRAIYNRDGRCKGNFGSCMSGGRHASFYEDAVKAKAAYLTNGEGEIVARCIIFTEVHDTETGEVFRLAERQYSTDGDELLKRTLVQKLIEGGYIDGYKRVGAGCGEARAFVTNAGESMSSRCLWIECNLDRGDTLSYQDSFKYYDIDSREADNYGAGSENLDSTDDTFESNTVYSEYHGEYIDEDEALYVESRDDYFFSDEVLDAYVYNGRGGYYEETCFEDDCIQIGDMYYYAGRCASEPEENGIGVCPECGEYFIKGDGTYSDFLEEHFCCEDCAKEAEDREKKALGWTYAEYDEEYFEDKNEVGFVYTEFLSNGEWETETISIDSLIRGEKGGWIIKIDDDYYTVRAAEKRLSMQLMLVPESA